MILTERARSPVDNDDLLDFSGTITTGGTAQLLIPQQNGRCVFYFENISSANLTLYIGPPPVTVALTNGVVSSVTVADNGLNWKVAPLVVLEGGIYTGNRNDRPGSPNTVSGNNYAGKTATVTANALNSGALNGFTINDGGSGYLVAPTARLVNPWPQGGGGSGTPSATAGFLVVANGSLSFEHTFCPTSCITIFGGTTGQAFTCKVGFGS